VKERDIKKVFVSRLTRLFGKVGTGSLGSTPEVCIGLCNFMLEVMFDSHGRGSWHFGGVDSPNEQTPNLDSVPRGCRMFG
jgi:hypothetical protein